MNRVVKAGYSTAAPGQKKGLLQAKIYDTLGLTYLTKLCVIFLYFKFVFDLISKTVELKTQETTTSVNAQT